jgi:uncharacterized protein Yka (UPF0111/DUF47 family)
LGVKITGIRRNAWPAGGDRGQGGPREEGPSGAEQARAAARRAGARRWWGFLLAEDERFMALLRAQAQVAIDACDLLRRRGTPSEMAEVELRGDTVRRDLSAALAGTFATPLDRHDIFALSRYLDDVVDSAQDALLTIAVIGPTWTGHAEEMSHAVAEAAEALERAVAALPRPQAREPARKVKRAENIVGALYRYGVDLALRQHPPDEALRLREVYAALREVAVAAGRAADLVSDVAVKEK